MNRFLRSLMHCTLISTFLFSHQSFAQMVGSEVFLQGDHVEIGIATNGAFGSDGDAPVGYHPRGVGLMLGFVADPDKDGWAVGTPNYIGDYYLPGSPQEGWDIEYNGNWARAWRAGGGTSFTGGLTGSCSGYNTTSTFKEGIWTGTLGALSIRAVTKLKNDKVYFLTKVTIRNTGSTTMYNIYYDRTVDPDNEVATPGGGSFVTDNKIVFAIPSTDNKSLVTAIGTSSIKAYLGLASKDCRAKPYIIRGGLQPTDSLNKLHSGNGVTNAIFAVDSNYSNDVGIGMVFKIDSIKAGDSTQLSYAYILREADLDSAFEDLKPEFLIADKPYFSNDTARACAGAKLAIDIVNGDYFDWEWSPATGLSTTKGPKIVLTVGSTPITYTATVTNPVCYTPELKITVVPIPPPPPPVVTGPIYYCRYDVAAPLTATPSPPSVLRWYTSSTGGTPMSSMTPATNIVGSRYYYVSQIRDSLCESFRDSILVITRALPVTDLFTSKNPTVCAGKDGEITFRTDSANTTFTLNYDKDGVPYSVPFTTDASGFYTLSGLGRGSYTAFVVVNKYGCKSVPFFGPLNLVDPVPPGPPVSNNGPLCVDALAQLTAVSVPGATYSWTGPGGFSSTDQNPTFITKVNSDGVYTLLVTVGECVHLPSTTTLVITPTPKKQQFASPFSICEQSNLKVDILTENPSITYVWSGNGVNQLNQPLTIPNIQLDQSGRYFMTATSDNGCITRDTIDIIVDRKVSFSLSADTTICSVDSAILNVNSNAQQYAWSPGKGLSDSVSGNVKARPEATTTFTVIAKSGNTCPDTSGKVKVTVIPTPKVLGYDTTVRMNIPYTVLPTFGQEVIKWRWTPSDSLSCSDCPNPVFNSNRMMVYKIEGISKEGCIGTDVVKIDVFCDGANVTMPNAFTPNGDGNNDIFYVRGTGFTVKSFSVYNRLGQLIFNKENFTPNDPQYGWDGTFGGQAISDAAGFVYMMEIICFNSKNAPELIKGTVLMIK